MLANLQKLTLWQRRLVFFLVFGGILMALIAVTWILVKQALTSGPRAHAAAIDPNDTVREFAILPDNDAYPAAAAVGADGIVYTGSYKTGVIWSITPDGTVSEIPGTRDSIGAVSGIAVESDGSLLVVDQLDADPRTAGGKVVRVADGVVSDFAAINDDQGFIAPNDIVVDGAGGIYVSDPGRNEVWRFDSSGAGTVWWVPPDPQPAADGSIPRRGLTGLAYDGTRSAIVITDPEVNDIFRVAIADGATEQIYHHGNRPEPPGFDGATVASDGTLYVAALGTNGIAIVKDNTLEYIAAGFRGASDVEFSAPNRLYVTNFDQASLAPIILPLFAPQLPFALDVIELGAP